MNSLIYYKARANRPYKLNVNIMTPVIVLKGKREDIDEIGVKLFKDRLNAMEYCRIFNMPGKHWIYAEIVEPDKMYEFFTEDYNNSFDNLVVSETPKLEDYL